MINFKKINIYEMINTAYAVNIIYNILETGILEDIAKEKKTTVELSIEKNLDLPILTALMDACVSLGLISKIGAQYQIAKQGKYFLKISNAWPKDYLLVWGRHLNPAFSKLPISIKNGNNAFELVHGKKIWDFYANNEDENKIFVDFMNGITDQGHTKIIVDNIELHGCKTILDVGGGVGSLGCALANKFTDVSVTVFDQNANYKKAHKKITQNSTNSNCDFKGGDIFKEIPPNYDLYTIKHVHHDWNDDSAKIILTRISNAMRIDSKLMIIEGILDRDFKSNNYDSVYLHMRNVEQMTWTPGKIRSLEEFAFLLNQVGLFIDKVNHSELFDISYILCKKI